jgi:hypothetical protein
MLTGMALAPWELEDSAASLIQTISANPVQGEVAPPFLPGLIGVYPGLPLFLLALWRNGFLPWWPAATEPSQPT